MSRIGARYNVYFAVERAEESEALEGTGSLVFDHENYKVYCQLSERACRKTLDGFMKKWNSLCQHPYRLVTFHSFDNKPEPNPIYHTNVVMAILDKHVVCCLDSIHDKEEKAMMLKEIQEGRRKVIDISYDEMNNMCGNML